MKKNMDKFKTRADIIKAMAHPTRLFIMEEVSKGKCCVNALHDKIGSDLSTVSKHLSVLKKAGILVGEKVGTQVYYSLKRPCIMNFVDCIEELIKENALENLRNL